VSIDVQSALIGVFVVVAVATGMALRRRRRRADILFVILSINLVLWFLATFLRGVYGTDPWTRVELAIAALIPAWVAMLFSDLLRGGAQARRMVTISFPLSAIVGVTTLSPLGDLFVVQALTAFFVMMMILLASQVLLRSTELALGTVEYTRLRYLAIGAVVTTGLAVVGRVPFLGALATAIGHLGVMLYVFFLSQAILRDRLLDLHEFIARMVVLAVLTLLFGAISSVLIVGLGNNPSLRLFNTVVSVIILLTLYEPLKDRLEPKAIEIFFRERHGLAQLLEGLRRRMLRVLDPAGLGQLVVDTLYDTRRATHAAIYLLEPLGRSFALQAFRGPEPAQRVDERELPALWHAIQRNRAPILTEQLSRAQQEGPEKGANRDLIEALRNVSADVLLPFVSGGSVLGFLAVRDDRVAEPYSTEEIALLMNIAETAVIVLENSQLASRLRERDRLAAIGEMAAGLAHEIRNPLGAIKGAAEYLDPRSFQERRSGGAGAAAGDDAEFLQVIIDETNRLNSVVSQFLDYARPFRANFAPTDVNEVVRKTAKLIEARENSRPTRLELDLDEHMPPAEVDAEQIKQVILNLVLNGVEASGASGKPVTLTTRYSEERERYEIRVRDRGCGIPREELDSIFIPFFTTKPQGTGLGLAVCQRIVNNHGGYIHVESQLGEGSEFIVRLPLRRRKESSITGGFKDKELAAARALSAASSPAAPALAPKLGSGPAGSGGDPSPAKS
jgi:signal transduction histidine kinase